MSVLKMSIEEKQFGQLNTSVFYQWLQGVLLVFMLLMQPFAWAQESAPYTETSNSIDVEVEQPQWTAEDITGVWEVVSRVYLTVLEEEGASPDFIADIKAVNTSLAEKKIIERFSDEVYNHFDSEMGGENIIYDRSSDALFIYDTGAPVIYQFTVAQYQDDFLDDGGHDSHWAHVETITQAQPPMFGLEVEQVRYWDEPDEDKNTAEMLYWVSSELPSWFYELKGLGVPGYALKQLNSTSIEGHQVDIHKEAIA